MEQQVTKVQELSIKIIDWRMHYGILMNIYNKKQKQNNNFKKVFQGCLFHNIVYGVLCAHYKQTQ